MKKGLIFLLVFLVLVVGAIYIFIPNQLRVSRELLLNANSFGVYRSLADENTWNKWWPNNVSSKTNELPELDGFQFEVRNKLFKTLEVGLKSPGQDYSSGILFIPIEHD